MRLDQPSSFAAIPAAVKEVDMKAINEITFRRGPHEYRIRQSKRAANDRFEGVIDGVVLIEADSPARALGALIASPQPSPSVASAGAVGD